MVFGAAVFFARSNEPCADRMADGQRELAHSWTYDRLDAYGERRDSERLKASNLSEWPIEQEVRIMGLPERWQGAQVRPDPVQPGSGAVWLREIS